MDKAVEYTLTLNDIVAEDVTCQYHSYLEIWVEKDPERVYYHEANEIYSCH